MQVGRWFGWVVLLLAGVWGAGRAEAQVCSSYGAAELKGTVTDPVLEEASGLTASQLNPGILWTVTDSGNPAYLYALGGDGVLRDTLYLSGSENVDWEDVAVGPCPEACACLYVADTGGAGAAREAGTVYRVSEPVVGENEGATAQAVALAFAYPDGPHDAEALLVHPLTGELLVVAREEDGTNQVYAFPTLEEGAGPLTLRWVLELSLEGKGSEGKAATGAAVAPDGRRLVVRSGTVAQEYAVEEGADLASALEGEPLLVELPEMAQGEGIAYSADGTQLLLGSEQVPSPLYALTCLDERDSSTPIPALGVTCQDATEAGPIYGCGCQAGGRGLEGGISRAGLGLLVAGGWLWGQTRRRRSRGSR